MTIFYEIDVIASMFINNNTEGKSINSDWNPNVKISGAFYPGHIVSIKDKITPGNTGLLVLGTFSDLRIDVKDGDTIFLFDGPNREIAVCKVINLRYYSK